MSGLRFFVWGPFAIPMMILAAAIWLRVDPPEWVIESREAVFDEYNRRFPRDIAPVMPVRIVDIDEETLRRTEQWPWPRTEVARLTRRLRELGTAVVAFDVVFAEPDRTSPRALAAAIEETEGRSDLARRLAELPDNDDVLAATIAEVGGVVTGFSFSTRAVEHVPATKASFAARLARGATPLPRQVYQFRGVTASLPALEEAAAGNGNFNMDPGGERAVRRVPLIASLIVPDRDGDGREDHEVYPALTIEALRVAQDESTIQVLGAPDGQGVQTVRVGRFRIPTDRQAQVRVYYTGKDGCRYVPAWIVLDDSDTEAIARHVAAKREACPHMPVWQVDAGSDPMAPIRAALDGHIVLIGTSAAGLLDLRTTPLDSVVPGVEVHAEILEQVMQGMLIERPIWAPLTELIFLGVVGLLLIMLAPRVNAIWTAALLVGCVGAAISGSIYAFTDATSRAAAELLAGSQAVADPGHLLDPVYPSAALILIYLTASLLAFMKTEAERAQVRDAFGLYLSPVLVEELAADPSRLKLGGELRPMTILFSDIRGFTSISEQFDPEGLTRLINAFLTPMTQIVMERRGTIDKYMGDALMAFWNAPLDDPEHAANACRAALEMTASLAPLNERLEREAVEAGRKFIPLKAGIGLNSGDGCVGNMGSEQRFAYSVLGDAVNLASRLEGQTKGYGVDIIIGEATRAMVPDFAAIELDLIRVKGKLEPVTIYALMGDEAAAVSPRHRTMAETVDRLLAAYRAQDWQAAEAMVAEVRGVGAGKLDVLADIYAERIAEFRADPPGEGWDGVYVATTK